MNCCQYDLRKRIACCRVDRPPRVRLAALQIHKQDDRPAEDDCQEEEQDAVTAPYISLGGTAAPLVFPVSYFVPVVKYLIGTHHPEDQIIRG